MRNSIFHRKVIALTLVTVLLTFSVQVISSGQSPASPDKIKDGSTRYVVWVVTDIDKEWGGSGVLISRNYRLVVTNAHVTGTHKEVLVFFAVRDSSGDIVRARPFYKNKDHQNTLQRLGYVTRGRVIAKYNLLENEPDLAIIELDGLPATISPLELPRSIDYSKMKDEPVHILGHPVERPLWHWTAGFFQEKKDSYLLIFGDAYFGNSGGPVLNKDKRLIGITKGGNTDKGTTLAVPTSAIVDLYKTLERVEIFSIYNNTDLPIKYKIKWNEDKDWKEEEKPIEPKKERLHSLLSKDITTGYPKIHYEDSQNSKESLESDQKLETNSRSFGIGIKDVGDFNDHIEINDALRYQFKSDPETKNISLVKMKPVQSVILENNTDSTIFFQFRWHEDSKWVEPYIRPNKTWKSGSLSEKVSQGYPRIRFDNIQGDREYLERNRSSLTLLTQTGYFDETTTIKEDLYQTGWNPPLYYQFNNNAETNRIFLDELRRTQTFSIQNATEAHITFSYKWHENGKWEQGHVPPNATGYYSQFSEKVSIDYPKISYSETLSTNEHKISSNFASTGDNKFPEKIQKLETQTRYSGKSTNVPVDINQSTPRGYHFKYNAETKKLSLHQGLLAISKKSKGRSLPVFAVVLITVLIIEVLVIVILVVDYYFPKGHIFSLQNNTEAAVNYHVKWTKKGGWKSNSLDPSKSRNHRWTGFFKRRPKIAFDQIGNGEKRTIAVELETGSRRFRRNTSTQVNEEDVRKYHFGYNPDTNELTLYDSEQM